MQSLVTIATPVYNAMPYLSSYLDSLISQSWDNIQLILVDDESSDDSASCIRSNMDRLKARFSDVLFISIPHAGQAAAMNRALELVKGEFFTWCDADDLLAPESVEAKARYLIENPDVSMVRSNGMRLNADTLSEIGEYATDGDKVKKNIFDDLLLDKTYCFAGCYMVRTDMLFSCYPDRKIPVSPEGQNLQLLLPVASRTDCGYVDGIIHFYRIHSDSHSQKKRSYSESLMRIRNFTKLRLQVLDYCAVDSQRYKIVVDEIERQSIRQLAADAVRKVRSEGNEN